MQIDHIGNGILPTPTKSLVLKNVLHVPSITKPLLSVKKLCRDNRCFFEFHDDHCFVKDQESWKTVLQGTSDLGLYKLQGVSPKLLNASAYFASLENWHARLGHPNYSTVRKLVQQFSLPCSSNKILKNKCEACTLGKLHHLPMYLTHHRSTQPLELIHSDVWGPTPMSSFSGFKHFCNFH